MSTVRKSRRDRLDDRIQLRASEGRPTLVPVAGLLRSGVSRGALVTYAALSDFARPVFDKKGDAKPIATDGGLELVPTGDREDIERLLAADVHFCIPSVEAIAHQIPSTRAGKQTQKKAVWPWLEELEAAGWIARFPRFERADRTVTHTTNLYLIAKREPFRTEATGVDGNGAEVPSPGNLTAPQEEEQVEEGTNSYGVGGEIDHFTFGDSLCTPEGYLGAQGYPPNRQSTGGLAPLAVLTFVERELTAGVES